MTTLLDPNTLRLAILGGALLLALAIFPCLLWSPGGWDQRVRFVALVGYGVVSVGGQINNLGTPMRWTTYLLAAVTALALIGTAGHLHRAYTLIRGVRTAREDVS